MAFSDLGISFGNFEAEEYEDLFGAVRNPQHSKYLELPWSKDAHVPDGAGSSMPAGPFDVVKGLNESVAGLPQGSQKQYHPQHESIQQQRSNDPVQQQLLLQNQQQQQQLQQQPGTCAMPTGHPTSGNPPVPSPSQSSSRALAPIAQPYRRAQGNAEALPHAQPNLAVLGQGNPTSQMYPTPTAAPTPRPDQSVAGHGALSPQVPPTAAEQVALDEVSGSSDQPTGEGPDAGKRRRNKKKRDPSFYTNFYDDSQQGSRTEAAYYADNESSGSSSGTASEAVPGGLEATAQPAQANQAASEDQQTACPLPEDKMLQQTNSSPDQTTARALGHHQPERTSPAVNSAAWGQPTSDDPPLPQMPADTAHPPSRIPPAAEPSAIQTPAPPTKARQAAENQRTTAQDCATPQGSSLVAGGGLPTAAQQGLPNDSNAAVRDSARAAPEVQDAISVSQDWSSGQPGDPNMGTIGASPCPPVAPGSQADAPAIGEAGSEPATPTTPTPAPAPAAAPKPGSWASLFKSPASSAAAPPTTGTSPAPPESPQAVTAKPTELTDADDMTQVSVDRDPRAIVLGEALSQVSLSHRAMYILPRGLKNVGNWCYVNSILQALLACPPFYHLMKYLPFFPMQRGPSSSPMLDSMVELVCKFSEQMTRAVPKKALPEVKPAAAMEPSMVYQMMAVADTSLSVKQGRQEDAEEFLGCLLNGLHEEMLALLKHYSPEKYGDANGPAGAKTNGLPASNHAVDEKEVEEENEENEDEWERVGPRNKSAITRVAHFNRSPLYDIFGGQMRSALHQQGSKESATLQPFFTLQLDIQSESIWSVRDAIENLGNREALHGFTCIKTKQEVEASRRITLEELPPVLILHLKRFVYDKSGGCQKVMKKLDYSVELEINRDLLSPNIKSKIFIKQRTYKLFAVVYHTGKEASGGHYITDVFHAGSNSWLRLDDSTVKHIRLPHVIKPLPAYTPYLLFYRRCDLM